MVYGKGKQRDWKKSLWKPTAWIKGHILELRKNADPETGGIS